MKTFKYWMKKFIFIYLPIAIVLTSTIVVILKLPSAKRRLLRLTRKTVVVDDVHCDAVSLCVLSLSSRNSTNLNMDLLTPLTTSVLKLGGSICYRIVESVSKLDECKSAGKRLVLGLDMIEHLSENDYKANTLIFYNYDFLKEKLDERLQAMMEKQEIWDHNLMNIDIWKQHNIKNVRHVPLGLMFDSVVSYNNGIDILLVGNCSARQINMIKEFKKLDLDAYMLTLDERNSQCGRKEAREFMVNHQIHNIFDASEVIRHSKIVLIVHDDPQFNDSLALNNNILFFLSLKVMVIVEIKNDNNNMIYPTIQNNILYGKYDQLVKLCTDYLGDMNEKYQNVLSGYNYLQKSSLHPYIRCSVLAKSVYDQLLTGFSDTLVESFSHDPFFQPPADFRVVALITGFNEADIVDSVVRHLVSEGVAVHFIDNWSTDNTSTIVLNLKKELGEHMVSIQKWPKSGPSSTFALKDIVINEEIVSTTLNANWFIHHDCDELRQSPWGEQVSLRQAIYVADVLGYNVVSFDHLFVFHPVPNANEFRNGMDLKSSFEYFSHDTFRDAQQKAWKACCSKTQCVNAHSYGGHKLEFIDKKIRKNIFPHPFVLRHYPIRSIAQGVRKIFKERKPRYSPRESTWHHQYDKIAKARNYTFLQDPNKLKYAPKGIIPRHEYVKYLPCPLEISDWQICIKS